MKTQRAENKAEILRAVSGLTLEEQKTILKLAARLYVKSQMRVIHGGGRDYDPVETRREVIR